MVFIPECWRRFHSKKNMAQINITNNMDQVKAKIRSAEVALVNKMATTAVENIKMLAPVLTGAMRDSVHVEEAATLEKPEALVVCGDTIVDYAPYVEFGTHRMAAQPFFIPGIEQTKQNFSE